AGDRGIGGQGDLLPAGDELQRAEEAGRVARREQLFGIGAVAAVAAQLARGGQADVQYAVGGGGPAFAAAGGGGGGGVEDLFDGHGRVSCWRVMEGVAGWRGIDCASVEYDWCRIILKT